MKCKRDDLAISSSPLKKSSSSRGGSGQAQTASRAGNRNNSGGGRHGGVAAGSVTENDALSYVREVKRTFEDDKEKYHAFLDILNDFTDKRIDANGVFARVKELFRGYDSLIAGFTIFLPRSINDYEM